MRVRSWWILGEIAAGLRSEGWTQINSVYPPLWNEAESLLIYFQSALWIDEGKQGGEATVYSSLYLLLHPWRAGQEHISCRSGIYIILNLGNLRLKYMMACGMFQVMSRKLSQHFFGLYQLHFFFFNCSHWFSESIIHSLKTPNTNTKTHTQSPKLHKTCLQKQTLHDVLSKWNFVFK